MTIYQLTCKACGKFYIGSTTRFLHDRVKEHLTNDNSSVKKHLITCQHNTQNIEAKIIGSLRIDDFSTTPPLDCVTCSLRMPF